MKLCEKIRLLRTLKGYTQEAIAESLDLSVTGYAKIERGETDVTVRRLEQIAGVFEISMEDILSFDGRKPFYKNSGLHLKSVEQSQGNYTNVGLAETIKTLYENRIARLEEESTELRKQLIEILKK